MFLYCGGANHAKIVNEFFCPLKKRCCSALSTFFGQTTTVNDGRIIMRHVTLTMAECEIDTYEIAREKMRGECYLILAFLLVFLVLVLVSALLATGISMTCHFNYKLGIQQGALHLF